jgi:hypothetical protein
MAEEKILTKHPQGKSGEKYQQTKIRHAKESHPISFGKKTAHSHRVIQ